MVICQKLKNQSFCNWFLFFHIFLRDVVMLFLSFFLSFVHANKQSRKQEHLLLPRGGGGGGVIALWDLEAPRLQELSA